MEHGERHYFKFGPFLLDVAERKLTRDARPVPLTPKAFDVLAHLVENSGHLISKDELMHAVWRDSFVEEGNLSRSVHTLRKALCQDDNGNKFIETVPTKGYRFVGAVESGPPGVEFEIAAVPVWAYSRPVFIVSAGLLLIAIIAGAWVEFGPSRTVAALRDLTPMTVSGDAYQHFQSGRMLIERHRSGDLPAALEAFESAIQLDQNFASAYAGKADAKIFLFWQSGSHDDIILARAAVTRAIELDAANAYAHTILCRLKSTYDWDFAVAETECRRAAELDPKDHEARRELAFLLQSLGRRDEALAEMQTAIDLAPTSFNKRSRALLLYFDRQYDEAIAQLQQIEATDTEFAERSQILVRCYEQKKEYERAFEQLAGQKGESAELRSAFDTGGWPAVLRATLPDKPSINAAGALAQLGETDKAFEVLDAMLKDRRVMTVQINSEPRLDPLRTNPRFELLLKRIGLK